MDSNSWDQKNEEKKEEKQRTTQMMDMKIKTQPKEEDKCTVNLWDWGERKKERKKKAFCQFCSRKRSNQSVSKTLQKKKRKKKNTQKR